MRPRYIALAAMIFVLVITSFAGAQPAVDGPEAHFKRGVALYQESDLKAALVEFRRAYELSRSARDSTLSSSVFRGARSASPSS